MSTLNERKIRQSFSASQRLDRIKLCKKQQHVFLYNFKLHSEICTIYTYIIDIQLK